MPDMHVASHGNVHGTESLRTRVLVLSCLFLADQLWPLLTSLRLKFLISKINIKTVGVPNTCKSCEEQMISSPGEDFSFCNYLGRRPLPQAMSYRGKPP